MWYKDKDIITMIYLNYLCDEDEKKNIINTLTKNEENYQQMLREKYNPNNIFKNQEIIKSEGNVKSVAIVKYKESIFSKFIKLVKRFLKL